VAVLQARTSTSRLIRAALLATVLAGCGPRTFPPPVVVPAPAEASPETLRWAVEAGLGERHWTVSDQRPGVIHAYVVSEYSGEGDIRKSVAQIGMGRAVVAPPPASQP
jgi:hypothetical protein